MKSKPIKPEGGKAARHLSYYTNLKPVMLD